MTDNATDSLYTSQQPPATADSAAFATVHYWHKPYYAPQYPDGLTDADSVFATPSTVRQLTEYPSTADRGGLAPNVYTVPPARSSFVLTLVVVSFLLLSYCLQRGTTVLRRLYDNIWSVRDTDSLFDEHTTSESLITVALIGITMIMEGLLLFSLIGNMPGLGEEASIAIAIGGCTAYFCAQSLLLMATGYAFAAPGQTRLWLQGFFSTQIYLGLLLTVPTLIAIFSPGYKDLMLHIAFVLFLIARLVFFIKSLRIFYTDMFQCVYFILYLCAVEIAPLILFYNRVLLY